jgi:hypothetical protein
MWNVPLERYEAYAGVYAEHAPELLEERDERIARRDSTTWLEDLEAAGFEEVSLFTHQWPAVLSAAQTRLLYSTYSDHMVLEEARRERLLDALEGEILARGGFATHRYRTQLFTGRAPLSSPQP